MDTPTGHRPLEAPERLRRDALAILQAAIRAVQPERAVAGHLRGLPASGRYVVLAVGKAAWGMARAAREALGERILRGIVITKHGHAGGPLEGFEVREAGHPVPDEKSLEASNRALRILDERPAEAEVLLLLSGGGSALFESPMPGITLEDLREINNRLLRGGASIVELNAVRKHLSAVKGGRLAERLSPTKVLTLALSDVLGDRLDSIASGPAWPDPTTSGEALAVLERCGIRPAPAVLRALREETPKRLDNADVRIVGSLAQAGEAAARAAEALGYQSRILTTALEGEAAAAGRELGALARETRRAMEAGASPKALIAGGETVVIVRGAGLGGRNQELALAAAGEIAGLEGVVLAALGTDGTDGPTDAAGGLVDGGTVRRLAEHGLRIEDGLQENDAYHALQASGDLVITGPTGTNVNDLVVVLIRIDR
jgi:hydroxypyruvate reductase